MRSIKRYIRANWIWIILGLALTVLMVRIAYLERGYFACGTEWLMLPVVHLLADFVDSIDGE